MGSMKMGVVAFGWFLTLTQSIAAAAPTVEIQPLDCGVDEFTDCNRNRINDFCEIARRSDLDCDENGVLDSCEVERTVHIGTSTYLPSGAHSQEGIVSADFNHDGRTDIAIADSSNSGGHFDGHVAVLISQGGANYTSRVYNTTEVRYEPRSIAAADMDRDGNIDLVYATSFESLMVIRRNLGNAEFPNAQVVATGIPSSDRAGPQRLALRDINRDGRVDVVLLDQSGGVARVVLLLNTGTVQGQVQFSPPVALGVGSNPFDMAVVSVRGASLPPDIYTANFGSASLSRLRFLNGTWVRTDIALSGFVLAVAAGDFNSDGLEDLAVQNSSSVQMMYNDANGNLLDPVSIGRGGGTRLRSADLDGDGDTDLATTDGYGGAKALIQVAPGQFADVRSSWSGSNGAGLSLIDVNQDHLPDFVIGRFSISNGELEYLPNQTVIQVPPAC